MLRFHEIVSVPVDVFNFFLSRDVRVFREPNTNKLHEMTQCSLLGTPTLQVVVQKHVVIEGLQRIRVNALEQSYNINHCPSQLFSS